MVPLDEGEGRTPAQNKREEAIMRGAERGFADRLGNLWASCEFKPACVTELNGKVNQFIELMKTALSPGDISGGSEALSGLIWQLEALCPGKVPLIERATQAFCLSCFTAPPNIPDWGRLCKEALTESIGYEAGGKLRFALVDLEKGNPGLKVSCMLLDEERSSFIYRATAANVAALSPFINSESVLELSIRLASRSAGWSGGPTAALHPSVEVELGESLRPWTMFYDALMLSKHQAEL